MNYKNIFCRQNLGLDLKFSKSSKAHEVPWIWVLAHETHELIDLRKALYFTCSTSFKTGNRNAYGIFVLLCKIVNNISFSHCCNTVNNILFSYDRNTFTKSTILSILQALRVLLLNRYIIFYFTYIFKLNKYIIHLTKINSTVPAQL